MLRRLVSLPVVLGLALVAGAFACVRLNLTNPDFGSSFGRLPWIPFNPDMWWQIVSAEEILSTGIWPAIDTYSFTVNGNPWTAYQWLGGVLMALAARAGELQGLLAFLFLLSAALILLLYYYAYLRCRSPLAAFLACGLMVPVLFVYFTMRPQLIGFLFLLVTLICLERFRQGVSRALWILPPLFLLWVNVHGTFPFGFIALGAYWAGGLSSFQSGIVVAERWQPAQRRHLLVIILLAGLALTVTPYGTRLAAYPLEISLLQPLNTEIIREWHPLPFDLWWGKVVLGLLALFLVGELLDPLRHRVEDLGLLFFGVYSAFVHWRIVFFVVLVLAPMLAALLARWLARCRPVRERVAVNVVSLVLLGALCVALFPARQEIGTQFAGHYPRGAVDYLRQHPAETRMFNQLRWGGYLIRALGPERKVFIDSRIDIYEYAGVFSDYLDIMTLDARTLPLLRAYRIDAILILHDAPLNTLIRALPEWEQVYSDDLSVIYRLRSAVSDARK